jgi:hypothetical protein
LIIRFDEGIKEVIEDLKSMTLDLRLEEDLKNYLSFHIKIDKEDRIAWIQQPHLINNLKAKTREEAISMQGHVTPGTPLFKNVRPNNEDEIPIASQFRYRSGFGMLLYLIKHLRPDLTNLVLELSKCMDGTSIAAYKEMIRVIRFVLDTIETCLKLEPNLDDENLDLVVYSVSNWHKDVEN